MLECSPALFPKSSIAPCTNPVKRIRSSPFASSFNSSIKESVSLEPADVKSWTTFFTNKFEKKQKNKPYKAFSRYRTDLSLVGLNSLLYMFFLRPPTERCFPSLSWIPLLSFQHLPLLLQLSHGLLAVFQQIKHLKDNSSRQNPLVIVVFLGWPYYISSSRASHSDFQILKISHDYFLPFLFWFLSPLTSRTHFSHTHSC